VRTLYVFRHAKAEAGDDLADIDRQLTSRGRKAARYMGELAKANGIEPQIVLCSSAARTRETISLFSEGSGYAGPVEYLKELYLAEPRAYLRALSEHASSVERAMVVGHNPGLEALVFEITRESLSLPTAALVECRVPVESFDRMGDAPGELRRVFRPEVE
jgi:phosphohistidine phosphatase